MKLNNIGFKKLLALTLTSSALILTGCHNKRIDMEKGLYFTGFKDVITADYLDFNIDGETVYFVNKQDVLDAIPDCYYLYDLGLKVDGSGNTTVIGPNNIDESVDCILKNCRKERDGSVYVGTPDNKRIWYDRSYSIQVVPGYRFTTDDGNTYDVKKSDIVDAYNGKGMFDDRIVLESNQNGGSDIIKYKK